MIKTSNQDQSRSYKSFVAVRTQRVPCLQNLLEFLQNETASQHACRIACLELSSKSGPLSRRNLDLDDLKILLQNKTKERSDLCGRLLIVEDLSSDIVETLGSLLNIDPLFFASHIDTFQEDIATTRPSTATLPSSMMSQNFLNLPYQRVVEFESCKSRQVLLRDMNVPRKVAILPPLKGRYVGLVRHCCSILKTEGKDGLWLGKRGPFNYIRSVIKSTYTQIGLILVDPPIGDSYVPRHQDNHNTNKVTLQTRLFQGGFQDFLLCSSFATKIGHKSGLKRSSPLECFIFYWGVERPPGFQVYGPTLFSISSYPLRMIAAEWITYLELMCHVIKQYEYSPDIALAALEQIAILSADIHSLQQWARRSIATANKIRHIIGFLKHRISKDDDTEHSTLLVEDYEHIAWSLNNYSRRLDALVSVATSLIQAMDSRRALTETRNISRLTYLALSFIPLTFVSGLFSMNDNIAPGGKLFWLYFAVSIPLCLLVFMIVHPPASISAVIAARIWRSKAMQKFAV